MNYEICNVTCSPCELISIPYPPSLRMGPLHWSLHLPKAIPLWWGWSSRQGPLSTPLTRYITRYIVNVTMLTMDPIFPLPISISGVTNDTCILYVKVWIAHVYSGTNAVHIHVHTYHRMGGLPSTLQHRRDMRMLWSCCLRQRLTQNWKQRSLVYELVCNHGILRVILRGLWSKDSQVLCL